MKNLRNLSSYSELRMKKLTCSIISILFLANCGGSDDKTPPVVTPPAVTPPVVTPPVVAPDILVGTFNNVSGVNYLTSSGQNGVTDTDGSFNYIKGDKISFNIEDITLGELDAKDTISVFSFKEPKLVSQLLYSLDSDLDPNNGFFIDARITSNTQKLVASKTSSKYSSENLLINFDDGVDNTSEYYTLLKSYDADIVNAEAALNSELFVALQSNSLEEQRFYKYLVGDYPIGTGSRYDHNLVNTAQNDVHNRLKRVVYANNFLILRSALTSNFSSDVQATEKNYNEYVAYTTDQLKNVARVKAVLTSLGDLKGFSKTVGYEAAKYALEERINEAKVALGDGVYSDVLDAQSKMILGCIEIAEKNGFGNCAIDFTQAQVETIIATSFKNDPVYREIGNGLAGIVADNAKVYLTCKELFKLKDVGIDTLVNCLSQPLEISYANLAKIIGTTNGVVTLANNKTEFYSKDVAYGLLQDLSFLGSFSRIAKFLGVESIFDEAEAPNGRIDVLLEAQLASIHPDVASQSALFKTFDLELARTTFYELLKKNNQYVTFYTENSEYQSLYKHDGNGNIIGVAKDYRENYYGRQVNVNIESATLMRSDGITPDALELCFTIHNKGIRNVAITGRNIKIDNGSTSVTSNIDFGVNLSIGNPSYKGNYCRTVDIYQSDSGVVENNFKITIELAYRNRTTTVDGKSHTIRAQLAYEGVGTPLIPPPSASLSKSMLLDDESNSYFIKATIEQHSNYEKMAYNYEWNVVGGDKFTDYSTPKKILFKLTEPKGKVSFVIKDANGLSLAETSINIDSTAENIDSPLSVSNIYKVIDNQEEITIEPAVYGGTPPYIVEYSSPIVSALEVISNNDNQITLKANNVTEEYAKESISFTVTDSQNETVQAVINIDVPPYQSSEVGFIIRNDIPRTTPSNPGVLTIGQTITKEWGLINSGKDLTGTFLKWDINSDSSLVHDYDDIELGDWSTGDIKIISVDMERNQSTDKVDSGRWYLYYTEDGITLPVKYSASKMHAYVSYSFTESDDNSPLEAPTLDGGVNIVQTTSGFNLNWRTANGDVSKYELYRSTSSGSLGTKIYSGSATATTDHNVSANTRYYYTARACGASLCDNSNQDYSSWSP